MQFSKPEAEFTSIWVLPKLTVITMHKPIITYFVNHTSIVSTSQLHQQLNVFLNEQAT